MTRALTLGNLYSKRIKTVLIDGIWQLVLGSYIELRGIWIIWGKEKNGKTWIALKLAEYLSKYEKVLYISAEEGTDKTFVDSCKRAKLTTGNKSLHFSEYIPLQELDNKLSQRKCAKIIFIDNCTIFNDELKNGVMRPFIHKHNNKLFVFIAHEERNEPYTYSAKLAKKLAKVIFYVKGLSCFISGRVPGGTIVINEEKAALYHGNEINNN